MAVLRIRIRSDPDLFLVGSGSGRLGPDPDPDPVPDPDSGLNKLQYLNIFVMCRSHKYYKHHCCLTFWFMKKLFGAYFHQKNFGKKVCRKFI
jgi:hypothetical protein